MKIKIQLAALLLVATLSVAQTPVVPGSILGSLTPITSSNGTLNAVFPVVINTGAPAVLVQLDQTTTITAGAIRFQVSFDGTNYVNVSSDAVTDPTSTTNATISMPYTLQASTNKAFLVAMKGAQALQILESTAMTGTGAITPYYSALPTLPAFGALAVGLNAEAGTAITNAPTAIGTKGTGNVMSVNSDLTSIAGTATVAAAAGVLKVGMVGNAGAAVDAAGVNVAAPANELIVGGKFVDPAGTTLALIANRASPLFLTQSAALFTQNGGTVINVWSSQSFSGLQDSNSLTVGSVVGSLTLQFSSVTGSPSGCTVKENIFPAGWTGVNSVWSSSLTNLGASAYDLSVYPTSGSGSFNPAGVSQIQFELTCAVYPTSATVSAYFTPGQAVNIVGANGYAALVNSAGALSSDLAGTLGTAFSTAGKVDIKSADGDLATLGAKADAKSTSTDTTAITAMQVLKEISAMEQAPASRAVTNAGTFAVQDTLQAGTAIAGKFGIDQTTPGTTNAVEMVPDTSSSVALTTAVKLTVTSSVSIKASAGNVYGVSANNGAAAVCWVQFVNSAGAGTLGSAVIFSVVMPASGTVNIPPGALALANFGTGIAVGIASSTNSSSACGTAGNITVFYK